MTTKVYTLRKYILSMYATYSWLEMDYKRYTNIRYNLVLNTSYINTFQGGL